ncbi:hypothetical protein [Haladaptatus sp. DYF46]|uniref:DUF7344 domain-containing protein n=1 Tax=Haladaptatus sp. DYF46 TaxID=2886041 RepID=UPI001E3B7C89|nr:hypothetical protein [Haladaptatus sp. DYF46]
MSDSENPNDTHLDTSRRHPEEERDSPLPSGTVERILSEPERRALCSYLVDTPLTTMDDLVDHFVQLDGTSDRETALIRLHHVHLPMLEDCGILTYEARSETVRYWGHEEVERRLELCRSVSETDAARSDDAVDHPKHQT